MREHNPGNFYDKKKLSHAIQTLAWQSSKFMVGTEGYSFANIFWQLGLRFTPFTFKQISKSRFLKLES